MRKSIKKLTYGSVKLAASVTQRFITALLLILLSAAAFAQDRQNSLAINGALADDAGPYYFSNWGDSSTPFAQASPLARALGLRLNWNGDTRILSFSDGETTVTSYANGDVSAGLRPREGGIYVNGAPRTAPQAVVVNGTSYIAIEPLARAFGFEAEWHAGPRVFTVDEPAPPAPPEPQQPVATAPASAITASGPPLNPFRVGAHDGYTRVALDLGSVETFTMAASGTTFTVSFDSSSAPDSAWRQTDRYVQSAYYAVIDGKPSLVINTYHQLNPAGSGFRYATTDTGTFYVDFGPGIEGRAVGALGSSQAASARSGEPLPGTDSTLNTQVFAPSQGGGGNRVVVIDPGHGGIDPGAVGYVQEHEVVLAVALRLKTLLESAGIEVILTRDGNYDLDRNKATDLRLRSNFATPDRNMFISIHANAAANNSANGIETWVFGEPLSQANLDRAIQENGGRALTDEALAIANDPAVMILRETQLRYSQRLAESVQANMVSSTGARDRGVKQSAFYVIRNARTPSILVEIGFVNNPNEGPQLGNAAYQDRIARGLYDGVMEFMNNGGSHARN